MPADRSDDCCRRILVREQVRPEEDVDVVGGARLRELGEQGLHLPFGEVLSLQEQAEAAADSERHVLVAEFMEQVQERGS